MKLVIELDKVAYDLLTGKIETANIDLYSTLIQSVQKGTPLPDNATNGEVIKALFPKADIDGRHKEVYVVIDDEVLDFSENWWFAPYKKGENNG